MNRHERELSRLTEGFLDERESFAGFHEGFVERWTRLPARALSPEARAQWNELYALVLTAVPDPVRDEDVRLGVIGEAELRRRLRRHPLLAVAR